MECGTPPSGGSRWTVCGLQGPSAISEAGFEAHTSPPPTLRFPPPAEGNAQQWGCTLVAQIVKNPPATQETQVSSLGWEDPLEEETATHCSIFAWEIPWTEEPGGLQSMGL